MLKSLGTSDPQLLTACTHKYEVSAPPAQRGGPEEALQGTLLAGEGGGGAPQVVRPAVRAGVLWDEAGVYLRG